MHLDSRWAQSPEETPRSRLHGSRRQAVDPSRDTEMGALWVGREIGIWEISWVGGAMLAGGLVSAWGLPSETRHFAEVETVEDGDPGAWPSAMLVET